MSYENYNYEKIQKSLFDKGWTGSVSDIKLLIQNSHNESTVLNFINDLRNLILKPAFDEVKPNFYNYPDRIELFEKIQNIILSYYIEPCLVEKFSSELYEDIIVELSDMSLTFSIYASSSFNYTKRYLDTKIPTETTNINFHK